MAEVKLRFYQSLNDFIRLALRNSEISYYLDRKASIKDMIESFNVPHTEVEQILVNGIAVDFNYIVKNGDYIQVYSAYESSETRGLLQLRPKLLPPQKFIIDANLGKLARYLRLLGFDCLYRNDYNDDEIARMSNEQQRIALTRDRTLLRRKIIIYGYFVRADMPIIQTKEVLNRFDLYSQLKPFTRCVHCNGQFMAIDKRTIEHRLEPLTRQYYEKFLICSQCKQVYWQGSHYNRLKHLIDKFYEKNDNA